ncbi:NnrS family protein [Halomonas sp. NO4]|uniref:NnrS family protein n=1 Tax=Halomonas sp. NO4 TaxID=2484813 RepID=UPI001F09BECE|nr:NnrS family protein [Halomonas sp. NO4]
MTVRLPAWRWFFPLAALHAALMVPLSLLSLYHQWEVFPQLASPAAHARELVFGFALAVVAGYLLGPLPRRRLAWLVALWGLGRLGVLVWPLMYVATLADAVFALWVAGLLVPRFMAAKKWRNRILSPLLGLICLLGVVTLTWRYLGDLPTTAPLMHQSVLWLVLLMTFMGGRIIAPAVNGYLMRQFGQSGAGVQPRIEAALIVLLGLAPFLMLWPRLQPLAAVLALAAGALVLWRLYRWAPGQCRGRPDLLALMAGYAWLGVGLLLMARTWWLPAHDSAPLHAFTIGALGTLASAIMLRQAILRAKGRPEREWSLLPLVALFATAATLRLWALETGSVWLGVLWGAAAAWSLAWLLVAWRLRHWLARQPVPHTAGN